MAIKSRAACHQASQRQCCFCFHCSSHAGCTDRDDNGSLSKETSVFHSCQIGFSDCSVFLAVLFCFNPSPVVSSSSATPVRPNVQPPCSGFVSAPPAADTKPIWYLRHASFTKLDISYTIGTISFDTRTHLSLHVRVV
jgi:hypothetical protein